MIQPFPPAPQPIWNLFAPILAALPRVGAAVAVVPLFPANLFPTLVRGTIGISLSLFLYPYMAANMPASMTSLAWVALIGKEVFIGALLGFGAGTLLWVFESVGAVIDYQVGFSNAQVFDPFGGHDAGLLGQFMARLGVVLFVAGGGLQVLASLLFESLHLWPVASFYPSALRLADLAGGSVKSFTELIVRLAAPVVMLLALIDIGFGLVNRIVPQLNVFFFTMPIKGVLAALMIALYVSYLADVVTGQLSAQPEWLQRLELLFAVK
jgi:type III secretion protein T